MIARAALETEPGGWTSSQTHRPCGVAAEHEQGTSRSSRDNDHRGGDHLFGKGVDNSYNRNRIRKALFGLLISGSVRPLRPSQLESDLTTPS